VADGITSFTIARRINPSRGRKDAEWHARSLNDTTAPASLDLRKSEDVKALVQALEAVDLDAVMAAEPAPTRKPKRQPGRSRRK